MLFSCHWALGVRSKGPLLASPKVMAWIPPTTRVLGYGPWHAGSEISMGCMMRHVPPHPYIDEFYTEAILLVLFHGWLLLWLKGKRKYVPGSNTTKQSTTSLSWRAAWFLYWLCTQKPNKKVHNQQYWVLWKCHLFWLHLWLHYNVVAVNACW